MFQVPPKVLAHSKPTPGLPRLPYVVALGTGYWIENCYFTSSLQYLDPSQLSSYFQRMVKLEAKGAGALENLKLIITRYRR